MMEITSLEEQSCEGELPCGKEKIIEKFKWKDERNANAKRDRRCIIRDRILFTIDEMTRTAAANVLWTSGMGFASELVIRLKRSTIQMSWHL